MKYDIVHIDLFSKNFANAIRKTNETSDARYYSYYSKSLNRPVETHFIWKDLDTGELFVEDLIAESIFKIELNGKKP